jgi:hypothetical protein
VVGGGGIAGSGWVVVGWLEVVGVVGSGWVVGGGGFAGSVWVVVAWLDVVGLLVVVGWWWGGWRWGFRAELRIFLAELRPFWVLKSARNRSKIDFKANREATSKRTRFRDRFWVDF